MKTSKIVSNHTPFLLIREKSPHSATREQKGAHMQARPHPQTDNVKVFTPHEKSRRPERDQRLCIYAESTSTSERPRRYGTYRHYAAQSQRKIRTIFGIGVVSDVVRFTCTRPAPECTSTFFSVTVRSASGARSLSVMVAGDFTATRASEPKSMPALAHQTLGGLQRLGETVLQNHTVGRNAIRMLGHPTHVLHQSHALVAVRFGRHGTVRHGIDERIELRGERVATVAVQVADDRVAEFQFLGGVLERRNLIILAIPQVDKREGRNIKTFEALDVERVAPCQVPVRSSRHVEARVTTMAADGHCASYSRQAMSSHFCAPASVP